MEENENILIEQIREPNPTIKYFFNSVIALGAIGFLIAGVSSYLGYNVVPFLNAEEIVFFPQGITMCFYGTCGVLISINQFRVLTSGFGEGYNEFNKTEGIVKIFRKGQSGSDSDINIIYPLTDIEAVRVEIKNELFNTKQNIFLCIRGKKDLPILQQTTPIKISELEEKASNIASFLKIPVKGV